EGDSATSPCGIYLYGETEDYLVNISGTANCQDPPTPGTVQSTLDSICSNALPVTFTLTLNGNTSGTGQTYQCWQSSNGVTFTQIAGATSTTTSPTIAAGGTSQYYYCQVTCGTSKNSDTVLVKVKTAPGDVSSDPIIVASYHWAEIDNNLSANCYHSD